MSSSNYILFQAIVCITTALHKIIQKIAFPFAILWALDAVAAAGGGGAAAVVRGLIFYISSIVRFLVSLILSI